MAENTCEHCGLTFAREYDFHSHRTAGGCLDVRADTAWHVDNDGAWTTRDHGRHRDRWAAYSPVDEHTVVHRWGRGP